MNQFKFHHVVPIRYENGDELLHLPPSFRCADPTCPCRHVTGSLLLDFVDSQHLRAERLEDPSPTLPLPYYPLPDFEGGETWHVEATHRRQHRRWWRKLFGL